MTRLLSPARQTAGRPQVKRRLFLAVRARRLLRPLSARLGYITREDFMVIHTRAVIDTLNAEREVEDLKATAVLNSGEGFTITARYDGADGREHIHAHRPAVKGRR